MLRLRINGLRIAATGRNVPEKVFFRLVQLLGVRLKDRLRNCRIGFGFSDLAGGLAIYDAVDKADKGGVEALSPEQRKMLDLYAYNNHIQGENKEHLGWGNTAGTVTAQALPFMLEMALNPASGVGKFAQRKAMQWAIKKYGKEKLKQIAKRYLLAKAGTRIAGDWLGGLNHVGYYGTGTGGCRCCAAQNR